MRQKYPILENDPAQSAVIEPTAVVPEVSLPKRCVVCFFREAVDRLVSTGEALERCVFHTEMGAHPVYEIENGGERLALMHPGVGAPIAAAMLEQLIALGCRLFVVCGGAGTGTVGAGDRADCS